MDGLDKFEIFMQSLLQRPLPISPMGRIKTLARELAEGSIVDIWGAYFTPTNKLIKQYLTRRWADINPPLHILLMNGYLKIELNEDDLDEYYVVSEKTFNLLEEFAEELPTAQVFISYRRKDSSAFALLVLARLKAERLNPFVDMSIEPGANWLEYLKNVIQKREYFVLLLGKETLFSTNTQQELLWAKQSGAAIIPIWHNGFEYKSSDWKIIPEIDHLLTTTHTIRVLEESALAYNNAIVELLNRFGITP